ncbi:MAG: hypothetical protein ACRD9L_00320, partial [Bryobacteraceae bacterium]
LTDLSSLQVKVPPPGESANVTITDPLCDWGRIRCYAFFGAIFSQKNAEFSQTDPYLDFTVEWNWLKHNRWTVTTFFDSRLTQIPAPDPPTVDDKRSTQPKTQAAADSGAATPSPVDAFASSKKSAQVSGGIYWVPYIPKQFVWTYNSQDYGFFPALIYKGGVQGSLDGVIDGGSLAFPGQQKSIFTFNAAGVRFGFVKWHSSHNEAHDLLSYCDFTLGKYRLYDFIGPGFQGTQGAGDSNVRHYGLRKAFEGRLAVPHLNVRLGVDANLGQGQNDLRFSITGNAMDMLKSLLGQK